MTVHDLYLALVLATFGAFGATLLGVSTWANMSKANVRKANRRNG
ncbi:hypothetical protein [Phenylobacterium sp.]